MTLTPTSVSADSAFQEVQNLLKRFHVKGTVIFAAVSGSHAYNLNNETSDVDYLGVYVADTIEYLLLNNLPREALVTRPHDPKPDMNVYEIGQFLKLLIEGNQKGSEL